jgi:hypothetical protein
LDRLDNIKARTPQKLMDHRLRQAAGIILDPHRLVRFIKIHAAYAINLAHPRHRKRGGFARRNTIAVKNIKLGHTHDDTSAKQVEFSKRKKAITTPHYNFER